MKKVELVKRAFNYKSGQACPFIEPNIDFDCILYEEGKPIGFFLKRMPEDLCKIADVAEAEFKSNRVPKQEMLRADVYKYERELNITRAEAASIGTAQYSTIIGSVPPKANMQRYIPNHSSVHSKPSAQVFIKAMLMLAYKSEEVIKQIIPEVYQDAIEQFKDVPDVWKFGNIFTSSISNYNIAAPFHVDRFNMQTPNVIITKRRNSKGGNLCVPEYDAVFDQTDNSMLVYPAWKSMHGVTPIIPLIRGGYRHSLVFYPLKAFLKKNL